MVHSPRFLCAVSAALCAGGALLSQEPSPVDRSILATAHGLVAEGAALRGFGRDYAVRFDADGMGFTPALGRRAERTLDLRLALASVAQGGVELRTEPRVAPRHEGDVAVFTRSAAVQERYEVRAEGVEQSFVLTTLPGRGELVLRCGLGGELAPAAQVNADGTIDFVVSGLGGARIGAVLGIDAKGARCAGSLRLVDGAIEMVLPADFVEHAALPLTVDPLVGTRIDFSTGTSNDVECAGAVDGTTVDYFVVWSRALSATSAEIWGGWYHQTFGLASPVLLGSAGSIRHPRVCAHKRVERFVVVWENSDSILGQSTLTTCIVNDDRTVNAPVTVTPATSHCVEPDLSGNPDSATSDGLLVYRELGVGIQILSYAISFGTTGLTLGTPATLRADTTAAWPRISKASNPLRMVAFGKPGVVMVQAVDGAGNLQGQSRTINAGGTAVPHPDVDGDGSGFMVVYDAPSGSGDRNVLAALLSWNGTSTTVVNQGPVANTTNDESQAAVAFLGPKYLVVWTETVGFLSQVAKGISMGTNLCVPCGSGFNLVGSLQSNDTPAIASRRSGGINAPGALVMFTSRPVGIPAPGDICAYSFTPFATGGSLTLWNGCGSPLSISLSGTLSIGNSSCALRMTSTDPGALLAFISIGIHSSPINCGTCSLVGPTVLAQLALSGGVGTYPLSVPCNVALIGSSIDAQSGVVGSTNNLCPILPSLSLSAATRFTIAE